MGMPDALQQLAKKGSGKKKGKKGRKIGRGKRHQSSLRYTAEKRWIKNKRLRMLRHIKRQRLDMQARGLFLAAFGETCPVPQ